VVVGRETLVTPFLWTALLVSLAAQPATGHIEGRVLEARTGEPLAAVLVKVQSTGQETLTGADGAFNLDEVPVGPHTLVISVVGYGLVRHDVLVESGVASAVSIRIADGGSGYVEEVTVGGRRARSAEPGVASQHVLGSRDLLALRGVIADDPFRAVQVLPSVATGDDFRAEFAVRGQGPGQIGIALDGIDSPLLFHTVRGLDDTGSLALINSDILESATLVSGAYPQRHGAHTGARLDFTTREPARDRLAARALLSATAATTVWEGPLGSGSRGGWLVAARRSYIDWLLRKIDPSIEGTFGFTDVQAKLSLTPSTGHAVQASLIGGRAVLREDDSRPSVNSLDRALNAVSIGNLRWQFTPGARVAITNQAYVVQGRYRNAVPDGRTREEGVDRDATWRGTLHVALTSDGESVAAPTLVEVGGQAQFLRAERIRRRFAETSTNVLQDRRGVFSTQAVWVNLRWAPHAAVVVTPGARVDRFSIIDRVTLSPWLLAEWRISGETMVRASGGAAHQAPAFDQSLLPVPSQTSGSFTHPPRPEQAVTADLGVERRVREAWRITLTGYYRRDNHGFRSERNDFKIVGGRLTGPTAAVFANTVTGEAGGLELTLDRRAAGGVSGWIAYGYGHARSRDGRTGESYASDYDQRHMVNAYASYRASDRLGLSARLRYGSNFPIAGYFEKVGSEYYVTSEKNRERQPAYARLDVRAERSFTYRRSRLTLFLETINTLNRRNVGLGDFGINFANLVVSDLLEDGLPFLPSAGVLFEF
jgi:hypothetical protein